MKSGKAGKTTMGTENALRQLAEQQLGTVIEPPEWDKARGSAERKLARIIEREGDGNGERRKPSYLAQIIAETVRAIRFSRVTMTWG